MDLNNILTQKAKPIILGLALFGVMMLFFAISANMARKADFIKFKKIETALRQANDAMVKKISSTQQEKRALEEKFNTVQRDLERVSRERDDFRQRYDQANKDKEGLLNKLKKMPAAGAPSAAALGEDAYWAGVLKEKASLEMQLKDMQEELHKLKIKADEAQKEKEDLAVEINAISQTKTDLERQVGYNSKLSSALSADLVREKIDKKMLIEQLAKAREESGFLRKKLHQTTTAKINLEKKLSELVSERQTLKNRVAELDQIMQDRMENLLQMKKELELATVQVDTRPGETKDIELPPIVVRSSPDRSLRSALYGQVVAINRESNFVIIDIGETSGAVPGQEYSVYQDNRHIATVVIIQTRKDISAADIKEIKSGYEIRVGDLVK